MNIADELLLKRQIKGIKLNIIVRLVFGSFGLIGTFFIHIVHLDVIIATSAIIVIAMVISSLIYIYIDKHKNPFLLGGIGPFIDLVIILFLPIISYHNLGPDKVPAAYLLKTLLPLIIMVFLVINSFALRPNYPLIVSIGGVAINIGLLLYVITDERTVFVNDFISAYLGPSVHVVRFVIEVLLILFVGILLSILSNYAQKIIKEAVAYQEKLIVQEKRAVVGDLAAGLAHEIKNQLTTFGFLDVLSIKLTSEEKKYIKYVYDSRDRINSLVNEVRALAKNEEVNYNIQSQPLNYVIEESILLIKMDSDVKKIGVAFENNISANVMMDKNKIIQVLLNLLRNAAHAVINKSDARITVRTTSNGTHAMVNIIDNGIGISPDVLSKIWEPFYTTKGDKGTGIGLSICKRIIEGHNGVISCNSEPNKGTTFSFSLPKG
ncbi:MAG: ATP-binding protein [Spirochaetota bacterium]|nr:ATP-binding protein [Spirochaetota bacterium]